MITKTQLKIFSVFKKDLFVEKSFNEIKKQSKQKSNNIIQLAIKEFRKQDIIKTRKVEDINLYSLNLTNNLSSSYLNLLNESEIKTKKIPFSILNSIQNSISKKTPFFTLIVFGSYAKGIANEKSDFDIAVIVDEVQRKKDITPSIESIKRKELVKIDYHIFTKEEFLQMLDEEQENLGKQIYKNNLIYFGYNNYLALIKDMKR